MKSYKFKSKDKTQYEIIYSNDSKKYKKLIDEGLTYLVKNEYLPSKECDLSDYSEDQHNVLLCKNLSTNNIVGILIFIDEGDMDQTADQEYYTYICFSYVKPKSRGKGIFSNFIKYLDLYVKEMNLNENISLYSHINNLEATVSYVRNGFKLDKYHEDEEYHHLIRKL